MPLPSPAEEWRTALQAVSESGLPAQCLSGFISGTSFAAAMPSVCVPGSAEPRLGARLACAWHAHEPPVGLSKAGLAITGRTSRTGARRSGAPTCCRLSGRRHPVARIHTAPIHLPPTADGMSAHRQRAECTRSGAFRHLSLDTRPSVGGTQGDTRHKKRGGHRRRRAEFLP
jgi:hypothetical protein